MPTMRWLIPWLLFNICFAVPSEEKIPENTVILDAEITNIDNSSLLVLKFKNYHHWHTYWKNAGDSGLPITIEAKLDNRPFELKELPWPAPKRYVEGGELVTYGFEEEYALFYQFDRSQMSNKKLEVDAKWLVCKHICIPGSQKLVGPIKGNRWSHDAPIKLEWPKEKIETFYSQLPVAKNFEQVKVFLTGSEDKKNLILHYQYPGAKFADLPKDRNLLTPFTALPLNFRYEKIYYDDSGLWGQMFVEWDGEYEEPPIKLPSDGHFKKPKQLKFVLADPVSGNPYIIKKTISSFTPYNTQTMQVLYGNKTLYDSKNPQTSPSTPLKSFWTYLLFAFLGGLILNLMPCVLPVISLKLFGLIQHQNAPRSLVLKHNLIYSLGVVSTFMVLAAVVLLFQAAGHQVGWGFQLQSPVFVTIMMIVLLVMALNFFGLFEFKTPWGGKLGTTQFKDGMTNDFMNGVIATILSTPCSAPFLGTALTFAFTTSTLNIFLMFFMIGLGLALPFLITGFFPGLIAFLPKPGQWMIHLKKLLGLSLLLTVVWLGTVLSTLVGSEDGKLLAKKQVDLPWQAWSEEKMEELTGQTLFIDFTAEWCLTCKVNEKVVLETDSFKRLIEKYQVTLLLADWTKRDEKIGRFLRKHKLVGVPAYFIQTPDGELISLGETLSLKKLESHFKKIKLP